MIISIDSNTIVLAVILVDIFMIILIASYRKNMKDKSLKTFLVSKVCQIVAFAGWALNSLLIGTSGNFVFYDIFFLGGNVLFIFSIALEVLAILLLFPAGNNIRIKKVYYTAAALFSAAYLILFALGTDEYARLVLISACCIAFISYPAIYLLLNRQKSHLQQVMGSLYALVMVAFLLWALNGMGLIGKNIETRIEYFSWVSFSLFVMMIFSGAGYFIMAKEQTDIQLLENANTDSLTGVLNRRAFIEQGEKALRYFERKKGPVSFLIFDLDDFKKINDSYGHYVGDMALKGTILMVQEDLRAYDFIGRYGGDEFALLLPGAGEKESDLTAERLRRKVEIKSLYEHVKVRISICIGIITVIPQKDTTIDMLYRIADDALYEAKLMGGNRVARKKADGVL